MKSGGGGVLEKGLSVKGTGLNSEYPDQLIEIYFLLND